MDKLIEVKNAVIRLNEHQYIKNLNLSFINGQHVCIYSNDLEENKLCSYLIDCLSGVKQLTNGEIIYDKNYNNNYFLNFHSLFNRIRNEDVSIEKTINLLFKNKQLDSKQQSEIFDLLKLLSLDKKINCVLKDLNQDEINACYLVFWLIVKPQIIFINSFNYLNESSLLSDAICSYLKSYLNKYHLTLIINMQNNCLIQQLCNRFIEIKNNVVFADNNLTIASQLNRNIIDNKTKVFDLESELLNIDNVMDQTPNQQHPKYKNTEQLKINSEPLKNGQHFDSICDFNTDNKFNHKMPKFNRQTPPPKPRAFQDQYENQFNSDNLINNYQPTSNLLNEKTQELLVDTDNLIEEIKFNQQTTNLNKSSKTSNLIINDNDENKLNNDENEIKQDLITTYNIRLQLEQQIKSPEFNNLSIELQDKVFENYERANELINEYDPYGRYDPNKTSNLKIFSESQQDDPQFDLNSGFTNKIITEELDENLDDELENISRFKRDDHLERIYQSKTTNLESEIYDSLYNDEQDNITKNTINLTNTNNSQPIEFNDDFADFNFEPKFDNQNHLETKDIKLHNDVYTKKFEPTSLTKELNQTQFETIKTKPIKTRNKRNKIEELYAEAISDEELIKDQFDRNE